MNTRKGLEILDGVICKIDAVVNLMDEDHVEIKALLKGFSVELKEAEEKLTSAGPARG